MIKFDYITISGAPFIRTWSDLGMMIARDGALYEEAIDPVNSGRVYTETNQPILREEPDIND